jgi:hypothetical protein
MVLSLSTPFKKFAASSEVEPIVIAKVSLSPRIFITVVDYSLAAGMFFSIQLDGTTAEIFTENVDFFVSSGSNDAMASQIVSAINTRFANRGRSKLIRGNETVSFVAGRRYSTITWASSRPTAISKILPDGPSDIGFCTGGEVVFNHTPSIAETSDIGQTLDAISREFSIGEIELNFLDDGLFRNVASTYPLKGAKVTLLLGGVQIASEGDWAKIPAMYIQQIIPEGGGTIRARLGTFPHFLRDSQIRLQAIAKHPLELIQEVFERAGFSSSSGFYDATTLDPSNAAYSDFSHHAVSRYNDPITSPKQSNAVNDPVSALDLLQSLLVLLGGALVPDVDGVYSYKHFDFSAAVDKVLDGGPDDGFDIDIVDQLSVWDDLVTEVVVNFCREDSEGLTKVLFKSDDASANLFFEFNQLTIDTDWINSRQAIAFASATGPSNPSSPTNQILPDSTAFRVAGAARAGLSGARYDWTSGGGFAAKAEAVLSTSRHGFYRIDPPGRVETVPASIRDDLGGEIIAVSDLSIPVPPIDPIKDNGFPATDDYVPHVVSVNIDTAFTGAATTTINGISYTAAELGFGVGGNPGRGGLNTTTPAAWGFSGSFPQLVDVTIQVAMMLRILERARLGIARVSVRTSLVHYDLEVGDLVSIDNDDIFLDFGIDGLSSSVVFEVVRKELRIWEDSPGIIYELAFVRDDTVAASILTPDDWTPADPGPVVTTPLDEVVTDNNLVTVYIDADLDGFGDTVVTR